MKEKKIILIVTIIIMLCVLGVVYALRVIMTKNENFENEICSGVVSIKPRNGKLIDDWEYDASKYKSNYRTSGGGGLGATGISSPGISADLASSNSSNVKSHASDSTLGLSVGGAKNIENFRENIKSGYFPISTDITYNGLFYDYYFDTGRTKPSEELFSPSYSTAVSKDPISGELEYYMTVGLNSNIKESDFKRKKLNVVVVMDISGSMYSGFDSYYYDRNSQKEDSKSKMQIANESLNLLIDELNPEDRLGIVLFDDEAYLAKPINLIGETDVQKLKGHILEIQAQGGTNFDAGYTSGTELFTEEMLNDSEYENRIIVITDAMPNMGRTSRNDLAKDIVKNAKSGIYTTFIGVGVDFNTEVVECLSNVKGANYYSVHSSEEFKKIMGEDFDYMVTPLVFDLELKLSSDVFSIESVYGTDSKDASSGTIMKVNTLFPSSSNSSGEAKGGIILLKLKCNASCGTGLEAEKLKLSVFYKDRDGKEYSNHEDVQFKEAHAENYDNTGIRKGIVLVRYANLMKNWILYERSDGDESFLIDDVDGIIDCEYTQDGVYKLLGENERTSVKLSVSEDYSEIFKKFEGYMKNEIKEIGDKNLNQEIEILNYLIK